jgi:hypothetical protein
MKSVFDAHREKLDDHEMMLGPVQGKLAVLLDILTDSMIIAGKHGIYCRGKRSGEMSPDMEAITEGLLQSKELVQVLMDQFRTNRRDAETQS